MMDRPPTRMPGIRRMVLTLAAGEIVVWAAFFYSFPALLIDWQGDLGWSKTELAGAFTLALVVAAVFAPAMGRLIDRDHGRAVLVGSAFFGGLLFFALSLVSSLWTFYLIWFGIGIAIAGSLYEPCFAYVTRTHGTDARRAITAISLIAGLAGTLAFPAATALAAFHGWRTAVAVFGLTACLVGAPLMWLGTATSGAAGPRTAAAKKDAAAAVPFLRAPVFWLLAVAYAMIALDHGLLLTHLLPLLAEKGVHSEAAVLAAALIGPMQVAGRLAMMVVEKHVSIHVIFTMCYLFMAAACVALLGVGAVPVLLAGFVLLHGSGYGVTSIVRPVVTLEFLGLGSFGTVSGALALPYMLTFAAAPTVAALLWETGGYDLVIAVGFAACLAGLASFAAVLLTSRRLD